MVVRHSVLLFEMLKILKIVRCCVRIVIEENLGNKIIVNFGKKLTEFTEDELFGTFSIT